MDSSVVDVIQPQAEPNTANGSLVGASEPQVATLTDKDFIEAVFSVVDKSGTKVPFEYNSVQQIVEKKLKNKNIIVKARKQGCSSLILAKWLVACLTRDNTKAVVISHEKNATKRLLGRVSDYIEYLPAKPPLDRQSADEIVFPETHSSFWIGTAGTKAFGRGDDITHLHISELDWWENTDSLTGLLEAVVPGGVIVIETTGNGFGSKTQDLWQRAERGDSDYVPIFVPWYASSEYVLPCPAGFTLTDEEKLLAVKYNLANEQINWRRDKKRNMDMPDLFEQEYPADVIEAFKQASANVVILGSDITDAIDNVQADATQPEKRLTVCDVAEEGDDETVIYDLRNSRIEKSEIYRHVDLMDTVGRIMAHIEENKSNGIVVDEIGLGAGVRSRLNEVYRDRRDIKVIGFDSRVKARDEKTFDNFKAEVWFYVRDLFRNHQVNLLRDPALIQQLSRVTYTYRNGRVAITPKAKLKEIIGNSPDRADALVMGLWGLTQVEPINRAKYRERYFEVRPDINPMTV